ncbi:MAG: flagellar hook capping FlgD N-terminal domain-containing protein [Solirubrobacteraceae bacterium]|nr:flagellar hook capping FlgD N-terminal domain-containing protein [Patulibacter sp.]
MITDTSSVSAAGLSLPSSSASTTGATDAIAAAKAGKSSSANLDKNAFLKLLAAQAKSQDPMNPTDSTAQIAQLAQFSSLEQMSNVATSVGNMSTQLAAGNATSLIGHKVTYKGADGNDVSGTVSKVTLASSGALVTVGDVDGIPASSLTTVQ